jgi:hypothetical protein
MSSKSFTNYLTLLSAVSILLMLTGCGGSDDNAQGDSAIQGNVTQVLTAMQGLEVQPMQVARWREFLTFVATAHAQGTDLSGITVVAQLDGVTLDTTVTDASGSFMLNVSGGELTLLFMTDDFELTLALTVPDNSTLSLTISLQPDDTATPVVVEQMDVTYHPITCASDTVTLSGESEWVIDGGGEACIRATGNCTINTDFSTPVDIQFVNCEQCIRAEGNAVVNLFTEGSISCVDALADGIQTRGTAEIDVQAGTTITVSAAEAGIDASGTSRVSLYAAGVLEEDPAVPGEVPADLISVMGSTGISAQGNATVEIEALGGCAVEGTAENLSQSGNASILTTCAE